MKVEFFNFVNELMKASPDVANSLMTDDIRTYLDMLAGEAKDKSELTENGKIILKYLQEHSDIRLWKSRDIADQLGIASRSASGSMRKLVNDGYCEKLGENPVIYSLSEKGKNYIIEE